MINQILSKIKKSLLLIKSIKIILDHSMNISIFKIKNDIQSYKIIITDIIYPI